MSTEAMLRELEAVLDAYRTWERCERSHADGNPCYEAAEKASLAFQNAAENFVIDHGPALAEMARDAERYRKIRLFHEARIGRKKSTVVMWTDEPWEPSTGGELDKAIDAARGIG